MTPKDIFLLSVEFAKHYKSEKEIERITTQVGLETAEIDLTGPIRTVWKRVLGYALEEENNGDKKLTNLLIFVSGSDEPTADNPVISRYLEELKEGRQKRLRALAKAIRSRQCILFLGPNVLRCWEKDGNSTKAFNKILAREMVQDLDRANVYVDDKQQENLSYVAQCYYEIPKYALGEQSFKAAELYKQYKEKKFNGIDNRIYDGLAQLPWKIVINTNPDDRLEHVMNAHKPGRCQHSYYSITNQVHPASSTQPLTEPDSALLYNIFGSFEEPTSILLSESEWLCFTRKALAKDPPLDTKVQSEFEAPGICCLFLGFDFDQWYVKIIFDTILKLVRQENRSFSVFPHDVAPNQSNREFFEQEFKIYFVSEDINTYVNDIITYYDIVSSINS